MQWKLVYAIQSLKSTHSLRFSISLNFTIPIASSGLSYTTGIKIYLNNGSEEKINHFDSNKSKKIILSLNNEGENDPLTEVSIINF